MQLLLVRHAEPLRIAGTTGRADPPLSERGRGQAERLGVYLADEALDAVWTSPLRRARETADAVIAGRGLEVVVDADLAEYDRDSPSYVPLEELKATNDERWVAMVEGRHLEMAGIDPDVFRTGVVAAVDRVIAANPGGSVVAVCHGGVINTYIGHVLGIARPLWFEPRYASISRIAASRSGIRTVLTLNEHHFLRGLAGFD